MRNVVAKLIISTVNTHLLKQVPFYCLSKYDTALGIVTEDEKEHRFVVTGTTANEIQGKIFKESSGGDEMRDEEVVTVPIDSVVAVQTQEVSYGKTAALAGGVTGLMLLIFIAIGPAAILAASAP